MTGLDTNVLVRYITGDDARQSAKAAKLMESFDDESPGFVSLVTLTELVWVLESTYEYSREQLVVVLETLLAVDHLKVDRVSAVTSAVRTYGQSKADFADCLIERLSAAAGCRVTRTFDKGAAKAVGMVLM